jgi:hypothetical protein
MVGMGAVMAYLGCRRLCAQDLALGVCTGETNVVLRFDGAGWPISLAQETRADLDAGLRVRGIQLCGIATALSAQPVATILLHWNPLDAPLVSVEVQDAVTNKRVLRDVPLAPIAQDARALALAQAADELLRASWVEVRLEDAPEPVRPIPQAIAKTVELPQIESSLTRTKMLGARFASELYGGGLKLFGADAYVAFWLAPRLGFSVALGVRTAGRVAAEHGSIYASALTGSVGVMFPVFPRESRFNLLVNTVGHVGELALTGRGTGAQVRALSRMAFVASARLDLCATMRITDALQIELGFGPGMTLRAATAVESLRGATNADIERISSRGLELHATLGLGALL